jgi:hypothetical protein
MLIISFGYFYHSFKCMLYAENALKVNTVLTINFSIFRDSFQVLLYDYTTH